MGVPQHLCLITAISYFICNPVGALLPHWPQGLGDKEKFCNDIAFLLVSAKEEATGDRKYGLSTIWVNPCQARVCSMEEVVKELAAWVSSGSIWPYALVQLNEDTCHVPLPKEGHLGVLPEGGTNSTACRRISQQDVHQLLISGLWVTYLVGLNGCEDPIITSLSESLANGISLTGGGPIYLEVDIPQPMAEEPDQEGITTWQILLYPNSQPSQDHSPETRKRGQHDHGDKESPVLGDVRRVLSCVRELDPKKAKPCGHTHTSTPQAERSLQAGGHLSQVSAPGGC